MSNSHIQTVAILTQYNARSLNEHLSSSNGGILAESREDYSSLHLQSQRTTVTGTGVRQMRCIRILIFSRDVMSHMSSSAAVTVYTSWISTECLIFTSRKIRHYSGMQGHDVQRRCQPFWCGTHGRGVKNHRVDEKPIEASSNTISTGIYVIRRRQLIELLEAAAEENRFDFVNDILVRYKM